MLRRGNVPLNVEVFAEQPRNPIAFGIDTFQWRSGRGGPRSAVGPLPPRRQTQLNTRERQILCRVA